MNCSKADFSCARSNRRISESMSRAGRERVTELLKPSSSSRRPVSTYKGADRTCRCMVSKIASAVDLERTSPLSALGHALSLEPRRPTDWEFGERRTLLVQADEVIE